LGELALDRKALIQPLHAFETVQTGNMSGEIFEEGGNRGNIGMALGLIG